MHFDFLQQLFEADSGRSSRNVNEGRERAAQSAVQDERLAPAQLERLPAITAAANPLPLRLLDNFVLFVTDGATGASFLAGLQQLRNGAPLCSTDVIPLQACPHPIILLSILGWSK